MNSELEFEPRHGDSTNYGGREEAAAGTAAAGCAPRAGRRQGGAGRGPRRLRVAWGARRAPHRGAVGTPRAGTP